MKKIIYILSVVTLSLPGILHAQVNPLDSLGQVGSQVYGKSEPTDIKMVIANIVQILLGLLGTLFIVLIIWGGAQWMMSGGNEKDIEAAKRRLTNATIGLVIVFVAYSIAYAVTHYLATATG